MLDLNSDLMWVLVESRQEQLRNESAAFQREPGQIRKMIGLRLIRLGEKIGGRPGAVPTSTTLGKRLALP
jgi:hypothetical protein